MTPERLGFLVHSVLLEPHGMKCRWRLACDCGWKSRANTQASAVRSAQRHIRATANSPRSAS